MKTQKHSHDMTPISALNVGQIFRGKFCSTGATHTYMKISGCRLDYGGNTEYGAVDLETGQIIYFQYGAKVIVYPNTEITISIK